MPRFHILLIIVSAIFSSTIMTKSLVFGSEEGRWVYPYVKSFTLQPFFLSIFLTPLIFFIYQFLKKYIKTHERTAVLLLCIIGFAVQATIFSSLRDSKFIEDYLTNIGSSPYFYVSQQYTPKTLLSEYHTISHGPLSHIRNNMPGKILFYHVLELFTQDPLVLAFLIMLISNVSGSLIYVITKHLFGLKDIALSALLLYLLLPAKLYFSPLLNIISPFFVLFSFYMLLQFLSSRRIIYAVLWSISVYAMAFFEPMTLSTSLIQLAFIIQALCKGTFRPSEVIRLFCVGILVLITIHLFMLTVFHFDIISQYLFIYQDAQHFNLVSNRRYPIWVQQNLIDFFINAGLLSSIFYVIFLIWLLRKIWRQFVRKLRTQVTSTSLHSAHLLILSFTATVFIVDLIGVSRGEIIRLWIFLAVYLQIIAAYIIHRIGNETTFLIVIASTIFQSIVALSMIRF